LAPEQVTRPQMPPPRSTPSQTMQPSGDAEAGAGDADVDDPSGDADADGAPAHGFRFAPGGGFGVTSGRHDDREAKTPW